jgi:hypothetical protein
VAAGWLGVACICGSRLCGFLNPALSLFLLAACLLLYVGCVILYLFGTGSDRCSVQTSWPNGNTHHLLCCMSQLWAASNKYMSGHSMYGLQHIRVGHIKRDTNLTAVNEQKVLSIALPSLMGLVITSSFS